MVGMELLQSIDEMSEEERMYFKFIKIDLTDRSKKCNRQKAQSLLKDLYERLESCYEDWDNIYNRIERFVWHYDEKYTKVGIEEAARSVWPHCFILSPGTVDQPDGRITYDVGFEVF